MDGVFLDVEYGAQTLLHMNAGLNLQIMLCLGKYMYSLSTRARSESALLTRFEGGVRVVRGRKC